MLPLARRRSKRWIVVLVLLGVGLVVGGVVAFRHFRRPPTGGRPKESVADKRDEMSRAFRQGGAGPGEAETREIEALLQSLSRSLKAGQIGPAVEAFNADRMFDEVDWIERFPQGPRRGRKSVVAGLRRALEKTLRQAALTSSWGRVQVKHIRSAGQQDEVVAYARHRMEDGSSRYIRWWVKKSDGRWRIYDLEDLSLGMRFSTMIGVAAAGGLLSVGGNWGMAVGEC